MMDLAKVGRQFLAAYALLCIALMPAPLAAKDRYQLQFEANEQQTIGWQNGVQYVESPAATEVVRLVNFSDELPDDQSTFRVYVLNTSDTPVLIGSEDVWLEYGEGERMAMLAHAELEGRHRRDMKRRQALARLGGALMAGSANGYTSGTVGFSGTTMHGTQFHGTGHYTAYDPALARQEQAEATARTNAAFAALQARELQGESALAGMLKRTTVGPGQIAGGILAFDPDRSLRKAAKSGSVVVAVRIGEAVHRFKARLSEI